MVSPEQQDCAIRALTEDGAFRVIVVDTTALAREVVSRQSLEGGTAVTLAELVTAAVITRETMSPRERIQVIMRHGNAGMLVADAHPDGWCRGLGRAGQGSGETASAYVFEVQRTLPNGNLHRGFVDTPEPRVGEGLVAYMGRSEQVMCAVAVACHLDDAGQVVQAGGYLVQLLPELSESMLAIMTERLADFPPAERFLDGTKKGAQRLLEELLYGMPHAVTESSSLRFGCECSEARMLAGLAALPRTELESLAEDAGGLSTQCDWCGTSYAISAAQLRGLLGPSS